MLPIRPALVQHPADCGCPSHRSRVVIEKADRLPRPIKQVIVLRSPFESAFVAAFEAMADEIRGQITDHAIDLVLRTKTTKPLLDRLPRNLGTLKVGGPVKVPVQKTPADDAPIPPAVVSLGGQGTLEDRLRRIMLAALDKAGRQEADRLKRQVRRDVSFRFDIVNPYSLKWIKEHTGDLVTGISLESRDAIASVVMHGFEQGVTPEQMSKQIREVVGLNARQAKAVTNRRTMLESQGLDPTEVDAKADAYAKRLLRERGENIARTETVTAANRGQTHAWQTARDANVIPKDTKKKWIAALGSDRTCSICTALAALPPIGIDDLWEYGGRRFEAGEAHPQDRCTQGLVIE